MDFHRRNIDNDADYRKITLRKSLHILRTLECDMHALHMQCAAAAPPPAAAAARLCGEKYQDPNCAAIQERQNRFVTKQRGFAAADAPRMQNNQARDRGTNHWCEERKGGA